MLRNRFKTKRNFCSSKPSTRIINLKVTFWNRTYQIPALITNKRPYRTNCLKRKSKIAIGVVSVLIKFRASIIEIRFIACKGIVEIRWKQKIGSGLTWNKWKQKASDDGGWYDDFYG